MSSSITSPTDIPVQESFSLQSLSLNSYLPNSSAYLTALAVIVGLLVLEQSIYRSKKAHLPGPKWTIPIIGKFADSVSPTLEKYKAQWASGDLSAVSVFNIFIVMAASNEYSRKIFNSPTYTAPCLVASMKQVLLHDNWVFLTGKAHVDYRKVLNTLFTRRALSIYLSIQDEVSRKYFRTWLAKDKENPTHKPIMMTVRDLNMEASLRVFCGPHIPEHACREISDKYWQITAALELVNFPLALPGTKVYGAIQARKVAMKWLESAVAKSKKSMSTSGEPECLVDAWVLEMKEGRSKEYSDREIAMVILSFLFASQDAMSSGLIYLFQHLADHPDILAKVREEQERVRGGDFTSPVTLDVMDQMVYLKAAVKESLRLKPPVTMVPYIAKKDFPISEDYVVPANSIVIPALYPSLHDKEVYPEPSSFIPERWLDENSPANRNPQNFMVFGAGPHKCIGVEYTYMHLACTMGNAAVMMNWDHLRTDKSEGVDVIATIFPKDGCLLKFDPRI